MFVVMKLESHEKLLKEFDVKKVAKDINNKRVVSKIMEYREISLRAKLPAGRYMIIPSTKYPGDLGKFYLNIYFDQGEENAQQSQNKFSGFRFVKFTYVNSNEYDKEHYKYGEGIAEEDEDAEVFSSEMKQFLKLKANDVIFDEDEEI